MKIDEHLRTHIQENRRMSTNIDEYLRTFATTYEETMKAYDNLWKSKKTHSKKLTNVNEHQ